RGICFLHEKSRPKAAVETGLSAVIAGQSALKTRVNALMARQSIFLRRTMDHSNSGKPEFERFECASRINPTCVIKPAGDERRRDYRIRMMELQMRVGGMFWCAPPPPADWIEMPVPARLMPMPVASALSHIPVPT